jgi:hypothetical protein
MLALLVPRAMQYECTPSSTPFSGKMSAVRRKRGEYRSVFMVRVFSFCFFSLSNRLFGLQSTAERTKNEIPAQYLLNSRADSQDNHPIPSYLADVF